MSASTPVKNDDRSAGRIDTSADSISPIRVYRRPTNSHRSAMDLYAAIHESKKRLLGGQQPAVSSILKTSPSPVVSSVLKTSPPSRPATTAVRRQQADRYRPRDDRSAARYDFKRLLLQTNMAGGRRAQQSAVVRLQQPVTSPPSRLVTPSSVGLGGGTTRRGGPPSWKSNVLSSTIQEDCREDERCCDDDDGLLKSAALVNRALKGLATTSCSALETAL